MPTNDVRMGLAATLNGSQPPLLYVAYEPRKFQILVRPNAALAFKLSLAVFGQRKVSVLMKLTRPVTTVFL